MGKNIWNIFYSQVVMTNTQKVLNMKKRKIIKGHKHNSQSYE